MRANKHVQKPTTVNSNTQSIDYNKRLDELTSRISDIVRSSSLGLIAVAWLGLSATKDSSPVVLGLNQGWLMAGAGIALIALFLDFLQYVFGYFAVLGDKKSGLTSSHRKSRARSLRFCCFYAKIFASTLSSLVLIIAVSAAVLKLQLWF
jgi:hypothetical protein